MFSGTNRDCVICLNEFEHHDQVVRLVCGHVFHSECFHTYHYRSCPVCRGGARVASHYLYIVPPDEEDTPVEHAFPVMPQQQQSPGPAIEETRTTVTHGAQVFDTSTPPQSVQVDEDFESVEGSPNQMTLPWWIAPDGTKVYLSVYLPSGLSIIVDPGAYTNLAGKKWARAQAIKAKQNGQQPKESKMKTPLGVSGVGNGSQKCVYEGTIPIAVDQESSAGKGTSIHHFECPIVEGAGEDLPALLGLKSMAAKNAVLEMTPGKECLVFPGPGGYELKLAPGYTRIPLTKAPSGHLCIPTDRFAEMKSSSSSSSLPSKQFVFNSNVEE